MVIVLNGLTIVDFTEENLSDIPSSADDAPVNRSANSNNSSNDERMQLFNSPASLGKTDIPTFSGRYSFKSQPNTQTAHIPIGPDLMGRYFIELSSFALI